MTPAGLPFAKWEGLGNDFVVVDARQASLSDDARQASLADLPELARRLCAPHFGVGADGLVLLTGNGRGLGMEIYNSDGSPASTCGNALRCLAAQAVKMGLAEREVAFRTPSGMRTARVLKGSPWWVEVDMGTPAALGPSGPASGASFPLEVELDGRSLPARGVSMGNPHLVVWVEEPVELERLGPWLQRHGPLGEVNVEFCRVLAPDHLALQVYERGAGATLACGSGACAALVASAEAGRSGRSARVDLPGGSLEIEWSPEGPVWMRGPARELFRGVWRPDP